MAKFRCFGVKHGLLPGLPFYDTGEDYRLGYHPERRFPDAKRTVVEMPLSGVPSRGFFEYAALTGQGKKLRIRHIESPRNVPKKYLLFFALESVNLGGPFALTDHNTRRLHFRPGVEILSRGAIRLARVCEDDRNPRDLNREELWSLSGNAEILLIDPLGGIRKIACGSDGLTMGEIQPKALAEYLYTASRSSKVRRRIWGGENLETLRSAFPHDGALDKYFLDTRVLQ